MRTASPPSSRTARPPDMVGNFVYRLAQQRVTTVHSTGGYARPGCQLGSALARRSALENIYIMRVASTTRVHFTTQAQATPGHQEDWLRRLHWLV